ncbi:MAG: S8 family serine peptidase [Anaerolineales bacterium]
MRYKIAYWILLLVLLLSLLLSRYSAQAQTTNPPFQTVILVLKEQPQRIVAEQVWNEKQPQMAQIQSELRSLDPLAKIIAQQSQPLNRAQEERLVEQFAGQSVDAKTRQALEQKAQQLDALRQAAYQEIIQRSQAARDASQNELTQIIQQMGGEVIYRYQNINALAVRINPAQIENLQRLAQVAEVQLDQIREALLNNSAPSIGAPFFWNAGFTGGGVDVAVVDTGIDANHPDLVGKVLAGAQKRCLTNLDYYYNTSVTDPAYDDVNGHGTHIAGIVASQDNTYRGVAFGIRTLINAKAGGSTSGYAHDQYASMADADAMACVDWAINGNPYGADVINLSFGSPAGSDDSAYIRFWDAVVSQMNIFVSIAAGNSGPNNDTLYSPSIAYNVLSVANINDNNTSSVSSSADYYTKRADDTIRDSSSRGPTLAGRKKPDIAAPGTYIMSTNNTWDNIGGSLFISYTGTSMASPHVAAAAALVMSRGVSDPLAVKALMINTAQDLGTPGWDNAYGWGYLDLYNLNAHINDYFLTSISAAPAFKLYAGPVLSGDAATLVWNRRVLYNPGQLPNTVYPLTNLDLYAYNEADNSLVASSTSAIDNVEQVRFQSNLNRAVIKVKDNSSSIPGASSEAYALATQEGFSYKQGPYLVPIMTKEGDIKGETNSVITLTLQIKNIGDLAAFNNSLNIVPSSGLIQTNSEPLSLTLPNLSNNSTDSQIHQWVFQKSDNFPQKILIQLNSYSYDENFAFLSVWYPYESFFPLIMK